MKIDKTNQNWNITTTEAIGQLSEQYAQTCKNFHLTRDTLFVIQLPKQTIKEPRKTLVINRDERFYLIERTAAQLFKDISYFGLLTSGVLKEAFNRIHPDKKVKFPDISQNTLFQPLQGKRRSQDMIWMNLLAVSDVKASLQGAVENTEIMMTDGSRWELALTARTIQRLAQKALNYYAAYSWLWFFEPLDQEAWLEERFNTSFLRRTYPKSLAKEKQYAPYELYFAIFETEAVKKAQKKIRFSK